MYVCVCFIMEVVLLLALTSVSRGDNSTRVKGQTGESVTLSCHYDADVHGPLSVCWNRGSIPTFRCSPQLIATDKLTVREDTRASNRYQLLGRLDRGNVSLTILNITESDSGRYGCRVDIPGWFNDNKHHFDLTVSRVSATLTTTSAPVNTTTSTQQTTSSHATGQMRTGTIFTSSSGVISNIVTEGSSTVTRTLVCLFFGLMAAFTAGAIVVIVRKCRPVNRRTSAEDNVYQMDGGGADGAYQYCP